MKKEERLSFYKRLLEHVQTTNCKGYGFCYAALQLGYEIYPLLDFQELLPELFSYKPSDKGENDYWFTVDEEGWQKRVSILEEIISNLSK